MVASFRIVLIGATHPGNAGASARAMKTMGLTSLYFVAPQCDPKCEASLARAKGGKEVLVHAPVVNELTEAVGDCHTVIGTADCSRNLTMPTSSPRQWLQVTDNVNNETNVAVLFGPENHGLSNKQLQQCHYHWQIPTASDYSSLNLGAAVQIIAYELQQFLSNRGADQQQNQTDSNDLLTWQARQKGCQQIARWLDNHPFYTQQPTTFHKRLQTIMNRAVITQTDMDFMMGLARALYQQGGYDVSG